MSKLEKNNNQRDELFNSDLVYEISRLAGFEIIQDEVTDERIRMRLQSLPVKIDGHLCNMLSDFESELFEFIMGISRKVGVGFRRLEEISKYPELVKEGLKRFETGGNELQDNITLVENKKQAEELFNRDLVHEISRTAGFDVIQDEVTEERIRMRLQSLPVKENGLRCYMLSPFEIELFVFIESISRKAGVGLRSLEEISKYPEFVKEELKQFEGGETLTQSGKQKTIGTRFN